MAKQLEHKVLRDGYIGRRFYTSGGIIRMSAKDAGEHIKANKIVCLEGDVPSKENDNQSNENKPTKSQKAAATRARNKAIKDAKKFTDGVNKVLKDKADAFTTEQISMVSEKVSDLEVLIAKDDVTIEEIDDSVAEIRIAQDKVDAELKASDGQQKNPGT